MEPISKYYILLRGKVSTYKRNPDIYDWKWAKELQQSLKQWKTKQFDVKVKKEIQLFMIKTVLMTDTKQILKLNALKDSAKEYEADGTPNADPKAYKGQFQKEEINIHMKMMNRIRKTYHNKKSDVGTFNIKSTSLGHLKP